MMKGLVAYTFALAVVCSCSADAPTPSQRPSVKDEMPEKEEYNIYLGNTHAHSWYSGDASQKGNTPDDHFRAAKKAGYDFYAVTDHSQYAQYGDEAWKTLLSDADRYTDASFAGFRGYEHSENNGPGAKGHLNVFNSPTFLNALADGIDMKYFHDWLSGSENSGAVVSMNHPDDTQYSTFSCYNQGAMSRVTMIELINGPKCNDHYSAYLVALSKGWKVSPVAGSDLHSVNKIPDWPARTGIAAKSLTRQSLLEAMREHRTFATYDKGLKMIYYVNGQVMGSVFTPASGKLTFDISIDSSLYDVVRVDICAGDGKVVKSSVFNSKKVRWTAEVPRDGHGTFFVNAYCSELKTALAYAAPVWLK